MGMPRLWELSDFIRSTRRRMRFGEFSRAPLHLLRIEIRERAAECDWIMRPPDVWDDSLPRETRERNESQQGLADAITMRAFLFDSMPDVESAVLRAFHQWDRKRLELMILGTVSRESPAVHRVSSMAMRAKLYGFCFWLENGFLRPLQQVVGERDEDLIAQSATLAGQGGCKDGGK
jgi:hypothetical protein